MWKNKNFNSNSLSFRYFMKKSHIMYTRSDFKSGEKFDLDTVIGADQMGMCAEILSWVQSWTSRLSPFFMYKNYWSIVKFSIFCISIFLSFSFHLRLHTCAILTFLKFSSYIYNLHIIIYPYFFGVKNLWYWKYRATI